MTRADASEQFLNQHTVLDPQDSFTFSCHPKVPCFNACCSDLDLVLTPLDVLRLRHHLAMPSKTFFDQFAQIVMAPDTGLPMLKLRMDTSPKHPCPFVSPKGCTVYPARPGACRIYPMGRASTMENGQVVERFFLIREPHCRGFEEQKTWTPTAWMADQAVAEDSRFNDLFMELFAVQRQTGRRLPQQKAHLVLLALYALDDFKPFLVRMGLPDKFGLTEEARQALLDNEKDRLLFALNWLKLILTNGPPASSFHVETHP